MKNSVKESTLVTYFQESIKKRQAAFSKTEQEIKERLADLDRKKEPKLKSPSHSSRSSSADTREIDSQVEANTQGQYGGAFSQP